MPSPRTSRIRSRLAVLPRALLALASTAGRRRPESRPARILVAHHLLLGDTLMLTPLLAKLRELFPQAEVMMTVSPPIAPLYSGRPYGVRVASYDPRDPAGHAALLAESGYDLAIVPGDNRYSWLAAASGARWIVAFGGDRPAYKSWPVDELRPYPDIPMAWGDAVATLVDGDEPLPYDPREWSPPIAAAYERPGAPYAVLHVGASTPLKLWAPERWRELAARIAALGLGIVWSGGSGERHIVQSIDAQGRHASYAGLLDLPQMWHLIAGARLLVCPDTGIAHLGRLVDTPTVALFGPGSATLGGKGRFWRDSPYVALIEEPFPCRNQHVLFKREIGWVQRCGRSTRECSHGKCMDALEAANVYREAVALLDAGHGSRA